MFAGKNINTDLSLNFVDVTPYNNEAGKGKFEECVYNVRNKKK